MYLVEIEAGREELYNSVDALASAIHNGEIGAQSRIYHRASSTWVSIMVHPEYKKAQAVRASEPLPPLARKHWTFYGLEPQGREYDEPPAEDAEAVATATETTSRAGGWREAFLRAFRNLSLSPRTTEPSGS